MYWQRYAFRVETDGITVAAFRTAGPLQANIGMIEEREGGARAPKKELGLVTYDNIVLTKGATDNRELWDWASAAIEGNADVAIKDLSIVQLNAAGTEEVERWNIEGARPVRFSAGDWDSNAEENLVRELELAIESFKMA